MEQPGPSTSTSSPTGLEQDDDESALANSEYLTRQELLKRRSKRLSRLAKVYRDYYWTLMEELKRKHREYYWKYGKSPLKDEKHEFVDNTVNTNNNEHIRNRSDANPVRDSNGESVKSRDRVGLGLGLGDGGIDLCSSIACSKKAMALSSYCHAHILNDSNQKLYKPCQGVKSTRSTKTGPILCGKPILISLEPPLCPDHRKKNQRADNNKVNKTTKKKEGTSAAASKKVTPAIWVEFVNHIQSRRRIIAARANRGAKPGGS